MFLHICFLLFSGIVTGAIYFGAGWHLYWPWIFVVLPLFYAFYFAAFATWIIFLVIGTFFIKKDPEYVYPPNKFARFCVRQTARLILIFLRVKVHLTGVGKLPGKKVPNILINNHLSVFDEFAIAAYFPIDYIFITKPENFDIPIGGPWMHFAGFIPIKQRDMASGTEVIATSTKYLTEKKLSICVAPEGTRNKDFPEPLLLPFHPGTFRLATDSGAPIVVLAIQNTNAVLKRFPRRKTHVYLDIVGVVEKEQYASMATNEIAAYTRGLILKRFEHKDARFYHVRKKEEKNEN